ncbi:hypothetical protein HPB47_011434 [Ixodes persulcatus]|uniref:Uncharacterized protein n=1 Tax=Ixodes persulcatus TaxID=34615 RepID=A0AC60NWA4_IXOPE|nr:hypothetical protein HPB47_011434 [Ixodes persulcatus]
MATPFRRSSCAWKRSLDIARSKKIPATLFKASNEWIPKRKDLSIRRRTMMRQRLQEEYEEKLLAEQALQMRISLCIHQVDGNDRPPENADWSAEEGVPCRA